MDSHACAVDFALADPRPVLTRWRAGEELLRSGGLPRSCRFPLRLAGLPWTGPATLTLRRVDAGESLERSETRTLPAGAASWDLDLPEASVLLIDFQPGT